jgi:copper chaperone CopZ
MTAQKIILNIEGMSCGHCSGMVQKTLEEIDGIANISVNLEGKKASFETTDNNLIEKAVKKVTNAGYKAVYQAVDQA